MLNYLKLNRGVDTYVPLKKNMETYNQAVLGAKDQNVWETHPNKKRKNQFISSISGMGLYWQSENPDNDVPINSCVVWDKGTNEYFVFVTTDTRASAKDIIRTYELLSLIHI